MTRCTTPWRTTAAVFTAMALSACDIPTAFPRVETRFVIPGETTTLSVDELLPAGVSATATSFQLDLGTHAVPTTTLGEMCGVCALFHGQFVPKPGFTATIPLAVPLPDGVESAVLAGGSVFISLTHTLGFDPLQPSGRTEDGSIAVTVRSGTAGLGTTTISGPFPSGSTRTATLQLAAGPITDRIDVEIVMHSPAGGSSTADWVRVDTAAAVGGAVTPLGVAISQATVSFEDQTVTAASTEIDLTGIDETMQNNVVRGAIVLETDNPFTVAGDLQLVLRAGSTTITKPIRITSNQTTQRVEFSGAELRSLLGRAVSMTVQGTLGSTSPITVRPGDAITISTLLDLTFELGAGD